MKKILLLLLVCVCACAGPDATRPDAARPGETAPLGESASGSRPNIVFIYTDDHSAEALGCYGSEIARTPNLDRLASQGLVFENAFATNAICAPARAVVLTGRHSHMNGVRDNGDRFDGTQETFPKLLQAAGYETALFGKWHLKTDPTGFDHWEILPGQGHYYSPDLRTAEGTRRREGYCTDVVTDLALDWLEERDGRAPFLLMLQHKAPHRTWIPGPDHLDAFEGETIPEPATLFDDWEGRSRAAAAQEMTIAEHMDLHYDLKLPRAEGEPEPQGLSRMTAEQRAAWERAFAPRNDAFFADRPSGDALVRWKYQRYLKNYLRCIRSVDDNVGRVLHRLEQAGLAENTIVVYTSDQGFFLGEHGWYDKRFMYEPALRFPLIVRWPGVVAPGTREARLVQNLDFAPTFLEAAGLPTPAGMQGASLGPMLAGEPPTDWRRSIYYQYYETGIHAVEPHHGVRTERYKLIRFEGLDAWELYDLRSDPAEVYNLWGEPAYASIGRELEVELERLRREYEVPEG
ncbi:MAG: sulfatase family protein [Planctomycetota bacterium]